MPPQPQHPTCPPTSPEHAKTAVGNARFIDAEADLGAAAKRWAKAPVVGLDTEFVRERTFRARPGLVQVSDGEGIWLVDVVEIKHAPPLASVLADSGITKVLHSVGEDLEVLHEVTGAFPEPLFDTQVAAAMLGMPLQCRYEHLVEEIFGVHLAGGKARNNWCRRPLAADLLEYAAQDVIWLPRLQQHLAERLEAAGRLGWLEEDCNRIVESARSGDRTPTLARVKGAGRLDEPTLSALQLLADWRESEALERDLPRRFVISDESLIDLARAAAQGQAETAVQKLPHPVRRRHGDNLLSRMRDHDVTDFKRPAWLEPLTPEQREQIRAAQGVVREVASELDLDPALIASKKALTRLVCDQRPDWLNGWRGELLIPRLEKASVTIPSRN